MYILFVFAVRLVVYLAIELSIPKTRYEKILESQRKIVATRTDELLNPAYLYSVKGLLHSSNSPLTLGLTTRQTRSCHACTHAACARHISQRCLLATCRSDPQVRYAE